MSTPERLFHDLMTCGDPTIYAHEAGWAWLARILAFIVSVVC